VARQKGRELYRNVISYFGGLVVLGNAFLILATLVWNLSLQQPSPYIGIFTYMIFPGFLTLGALLFLYGMRRESLRRRRLGTTLALPYPRLDLNDATQRRRFAYALLGGGLLVVLLAFVGYNAFLFTESVTFCGRVCHTVMQPEYTAYLNSPHARVRCVECHVGSGAKWYVKSKFSGLYQVYAVTFHTYETPIPVPVKSLRPARETCEECHWPQKFYGAQLLQIPHYRYDEKNTPEQISLLLKTGGGSAKLGAEAGIHWHMIIENSVTFAATDPALQNIPWISVKNVSGKVTEYVDRNSKLTPQQLQALPRHTMDCMDCHNRPSHNFPAPETAVDRAMQANLIGSDLPWIKREAVDALTQDYPDRNSAHQEITRRLSSFYETKYPGVAKSKEGEIRSSEEAIRAIYDRSVFPAMKVNWKTYTVNIGHRNWNGCFRCHDGNHVSPEGEVLSKDCTLCHTMPQRGPMRPLGAAMPASSENWHPMPLQGKHAELLCTRCHAAGFRPAMDCAGCHKLDASAPMMSDCTACHAAPGVKLPIADCKSCHDSLAGLHKKGGHPDASCADCHKPHVWKVSGRDTCLQCHDDKKDHNAPQACASCHGFAAN
jgi:hypothetical protein